MKRKVVRPSDSDRQVKSGQFRRKSIQDILSPILLNSRRLSNHCLYDDHQRRGKKLAEMIERHWTT
jgi:hypothetical protein